MNTLLFPSRVFRVPLLLLLFVLTSSSLADDSWPKIEKYFQPPAEYAKDFGPYRSPLKFTDGSEVKTAEDWARRRKEIADLWQKRLGSWPALLEKPKVEVLETKEKDGYTQKHVHVQVSSDGKIADGYLLIPPGKGPFPAVFVPFYEPLTSIGEGKSGRGTHDYGLQLVRRGFVTLSILKPTNPGRKTLKSDAFLSHIEPAECAFPVPHIMPDLRGG